MTQHAYGHEQWTSGHAHRPFSNPVHILHTNEKNFLDLNAFQTNLNLEFLKIFHRRGSPGLGRHYWRGSPGRTFKAGQHRLQFDVIPKVVAIQST